MPSAELHKKQAAHNKKFLRETIFDIKKFTYPDWFVVACFYYILHLVDEKLATTDPINEVVGAHKNRRILIKTVLAEKYEDLHDLYTSLEAYSQTARYKCTGIDKFTLGKAVECMEEIERLLAS